MFKTSFLKQVSNGFLFSALVVILFAALCPLIALGHSLPWEVQDLFFCFSLAAILPAGALVGLHEWIEGIDKKRRSMWKVIISAGGVEIRVVRCACKYVASKVAEEATEYNSIFAISMPAAIKSVRIELPENRPFWNNLH